MPNLTVVRAGNDLLAEPADALVNPVNTAGVMGRGLALQFRQAWPAMYADYRQACRNGEVTIGIMHVWATGHEQPRYLINFPTKRHWRSPSRLPDIQAGLSDLAATVSDLALTSIAIPALGCGLGGLPWPDVEAAIRHTMAPLTATTDVTVFAPSPHSPH
ncbi:macro domain-containing protein [Kineosporia sp. J2-2]|uniref:Macro domain-containing protein n=1 Tax=Kineosporia corallincola TaxID=2835133 RepID=A0ABS5TDS3_9ACTN|nr:macro domain-containing protein [Kineosporia corallincola]MBT0768356.1 macro domain-containing protein [Kineosporia corallincola]